MPEGKEVQLVRNGDFEEWPAEGPAHWVFKPGEVLRNQEEVPGSTVAQLDKSGDYVVLEQVIEAVRVGEKVAVSAKIKAAAPNDAILKVKYAGGTEEKTQRWNYKGSGQWQAGQMIFTLPQNLKYKSFVVQVLRTPQAQAPVLVDGVSVVAMR